jgi:sulfatase modifying factor 1
MNKTTLQIDAGIHPLVDGEPPDWASGWGEDRFGIYVDFSLSGVTQRMRWIPPGRFLMGTPGDQEKRWSAESPLREVTIGRGYWLFDTPCTQLLWEAVMGTNPSRFKGPTLPVERVSFHDAQGFLSRINGQVPGLKLVIPSEAQWEYACRAGTSTATYAGEMLIFGKNDAPVLDSIAWYRGNTGFGELDSSGWRQEQHAHERAGTHPVGMKTPNPWGLYDMLGNVWEWCADHWHENYFGAPSDGSAWIDNEEGDADRAARGGSWSDHAHVVRAASRLFSPSSSGNLFLGFRCARVQVT